MKAVIFDMDGVLVDSMQYHVDAWRRAFAEAGVRVSDRELLLLEGLSYEETVETIFSKQGLTYDARVAQRIHERKKELMGAVSDVPVYEGVHPLLEIPCSKAVVTGADRPFAERIIAKHFGGVFSALVTGADVAHGKPAPDSYEKAVESLDVGKEECLVLENAPLGIRSARAAGLTVWAVATTLPVEELSEADRVFESFEEVCRALTARF